MLIRWAGSQGGNVPIFRLPLADLGAGAVDTTPDLSSGSPTPTFTRATAAETNLSGGLLTQVSTGIARSIYDPTGATYLGYLAEGARTNLTPFSTTPVGHNNADGVTGSSLYVSPDGVNNYYTATETSATSVHGSYQSGAIPGAMTNAVTYCGSIFLKSGTRRYIVVVMGIGVVGLIYRCFDTTTGSWAAAGGATGSGSFISSGIEQRSASEWRLWISGQNSSGAQLAYMTAYASDIANPPSGPPSYAGDTGMNWSIWGSAVEAGSSPSSLIETSGIAVARNADVLQYASASNLPAISTVNLRWTPEAAGMGTVFLFGTYVDASNYTAILHDGTNIIARKRISGANHDATKALTYTARTTYDITARFDGTNGVDVWVDGVKGTNDSTTTAAQIGTNFQIGADGNGANQAFGALQNVKIYATGLPDAQCAAL